MACGWRGGAAVPQSPAKVRALMQALLERVSELRALHVWVVWLAVNVAVLVFGHHRRLCLSCPVQHDDVHPCLQPAAAARNATVELTTTLVWQALVCMDM